MINFNKLLQEEKRRALAEANKKNAASNNNNNVNKDNNKDNLIEEKHEEKVELYIDLNSYVFDINGCDIASKNRVTQSSIKGIYYIDDFIDEQMESTILKNVYSDENQSKWTQLKRRRLQNWGGNPSSDGMLLETLPSWLDRICESIFKQSILPKKPNHVLLNEYQYDQGIMPHKDGPLFYPCVTILSLGSTCLIDFYKSIGEDPVESLLLKPRSLLIFTDEAYKNYYHGIKECFTDNRTKDYKKPIIINQH
ncbi:hypothetical protein PPL_12421 [Heterostelium album PN500]|uniref:Alpha-ketoglutarate-dependent dioxygenase AlkB-like domain-containing protein n=1 Tax=Heterostelium pallidum (strain ATCC 26659 / Pp 5 / PN500) TaxID=670386 RepID=D3BMK0_HETP5|nr:hypothetical protein PPL_12421 [Heterostelium album PN500]EFA77212.1 hypothetical protein PPL_12421 [Heterostelium album PN500]|eukprot:XP_020429341.1 hypothetical protein PPL_12421 [Heterostelium album PN500]